jgi:hypothetical protein
MSARRGAATVSSGPIPERNRGPFRAINDPVTKSPHFGGGSVPQGISGTVEVEFLGEPCTTLSE